MIDYTLLNLDFQTKLKQLEALLKQYKIEYTITNGFRTPAKHAALKAQGYPTVENSLHLKGRAADFSIENTNQRVLAGQLAQALGLNIQTYPTHPKSFYCLHTELREKKWLNWKYLLAGGVIFYVFINSKRS